MGLRMRTMTMIILCVALVLGSATLLIANGQQEKSEDSGKTVVEVFYHTYGEDGVEDAIQRYAEMYEAENPDIDIQATMHVGDWRQKLFTSLAAKEDNPDVFELDNPSLSMMRSKQIAPLDDLFTDATWNDFTDSAKEQMKIDGNIYSVKMFVDPGGFYYRKDAFQEAGVQPPSSLEDLYAISQRLNTDDRAGLYIGNAKGAGTEGYMMAWATGITDFIAENENKVVFANDKMYAGMRMLRKFANSDFLLLGYPRSEWEPDSLIANDTAIQWGGMWFFPEMKAKMGDNFDVFPMPPLRETNGKIAAPASGFASMINNYSDVKEAAKDYLKWAWIDDNQAVQLDFTTAYGFHMPVKKSVIAAATKIQEDPRSARMVEWTQKYGIMEFSDGKADDYRWDNSMSTIFSDMMQKVVNTNTPIEKLVDDAAAKCQERLDEIMRM